MNRYDDYLNDFDSPEDPPQSGAGAGNSVSQVPSHYRETPSIVPPTPSKHVLLAAAAGVGPKSPTFPQTSRQIAAPKPGYVAPIATFDLAQPTPAAPSQRSPVTRKLPPPAVNPFEPQRPAQQQRPPQDPFRTPRQEHFPPPQHGPYPHMNRQLPRHGTPTSIPSIPHPLQPPITPITPVFARPNKVTSFQQEQPIMRGKTEDTVLPSRGQKGDDFWRRFSMVIHEQEKPNGQTKRHVSFPTSYFNI